MLRHCRMSRACRILTLVLVGTAFGAGIARINQSVDGATVGAVVGASIGTIAALRVEAALKTRKPLQRLQPLRTYEERASVTLPKIVQDRSIMRANFIDLAVFGIPFFAWVACYWFTTLPVYNAHAVAFFGLWLMIFVFRGKRRECRFQCPNCKAMLKRRFAWVKRPLVFHCTRCDTVWDTGLIDDPDGGS